MKLDKTILYGAKARENPQSSKTRFRHTEEIDVNTSLDVTGNVSNESPVILMSIMEGGLISKEPHTVQNSLDDVACKSGSFLIAGGPEEKENE